MKNKLTPLRAIRKNCLDCMGGNATEVRRCPMENCPLYPYRFGKNPSRKGIGNKRAVPPKNPNSSSGKTAKTGK